MRKYARLALFIFLACPAAAKKPRLGDPLIAAGKKAVAERRWDAAVSSFGKSARLHGSAAAYFWLGYSRTQRALEGRDDPRAADKTDAMAAVNAFAQAFRLDPSARQFPDHFRLYQAHAFSCEAVELYPKAVEAYRKAFQLEPRNPMIPLYAARLRYRMGDVPGSAANLSLSLRNAKLIGQDETIARLVRSNAGFAAMLKDPAHAELITPYEKAEPEVAQADAPAEALRDSVARPRVEPPLRASDRETLEAAKAGDDAYTYGHWREAAEAYEKTLDADRGAQALGRSQRADIEQRLGMAYARLGQAAQAVDALRRSVIDKPFNAQAYYEMALSYAVLGRYNDALKSLKESFRTASTAAELKRTMLLARTDSELEPLRDRASFSETLAQAGDRLAGLR